MEMVSKFYDKLLARQSLSSWFCVILGSVILSAGFVLFMNPYRVVPGGVYGTGIVLHALVPSVQVGTFGLMLDIPLLLIGLKVFGRMFGVKTVCSALLIPVVMNGMTYLIGENPATMFGGNMNLSQDMFLVCIFGGVFLAMFINNKKTKCPRLWRTLFMITIAVPQFVTLLLVRNFFSDAGIFNTMMNNAGVTDLLKTIGLLGQSMDHIPFLTDQHWAKFIIIMINIWVGIPYQMLIATGVLMNIPSDILEASTIDGASPLQCFIHIKLPYLLSVQGPALVTDFVKNVNNFNVIYLLTQDVYKTKDQAMAASSAKEVDLLVTWLFRLTQEQYNYKMAAVIGIMVFIICAIFTLVCFRFINKKEATFS